MKTPNATQSIPSTCLDDVSGGGPPPIIIHSPGRPPVVQTGTRALVSTLKSFGPASGEGFLERWKNVGAEQGGAEAMKHRPWLRSYSKPGGESIAARLLEHFRF
jgi:hypothetical protein